MEGGKGGGKMPVEGLWVVTNDQKVRDERTKEKGRGEKREGKGTI